MQRPQATHLGPPTPPVDVRVEFGARSRSGPLRSTNEDHYLILRMGRSQETLMTNLAEDETPERFDEFAYGMLIADGLGYAGAVASGLAVSTLANLAAYFGKWNVRIDAPTANEVMDRAERFFRDVDSTLLQAGKYRRDGLQTTLTVVYTAGRELFFAHVGHSRAYLFRDGKLLQLTTDHVSSDSSAEALGKAHAGGPRIYVERSGLLNGDVVLLCTNGLTDVVDNARIADALQRLNAPDDQCRELLDLAAAAGGEDDVTAVVAHYTIPG